MAFYKDDSGTKQRKMVDVSFNETKRISMKHNLQMKIDWKFDMNGMSISQGLFYA